MQSLWTDYVVMIDARDVRLAVHPAFKFSAALSAAWQSGRHGRLLTAARVEPSQATPSAPSRDTKTDIVTELCVAHSGEPASALASLLRELPRSPLPPVNRVHLRLAHPWAHCAVLSWQEAFDDSVAWQAYARAVFAERGVAGELAVALEDAGYRAPRLAVAALASLRDELDATVRACGWRTASCRDLLSTLAALAAKRRLPPSCTIALIEADSVSCLYRQSGTWHDVVTLARTHGSSLPLTPVEVLAAAAVLGDHPDAEPVFACAPVPLTDAPLAHDWIALPSPLTGSVHEGGPCNR